jgi:hypothetical protein
LRLYQDKREISGKLLTFDRLKENGQLNVEKSISNLIPEEFFRNCSNSILVETSESIRKTMYTHPKIKPTNKLYIGKEKMIPAFKYVLIRGVSSAVVLVRLNSLQNSGILQKMSQTLNEISLKNLKTEYFNHNKHLVSHSLLNDRATSITFDSKMMRIFLVSAVLLCVSQAIFLLELSQKLTLYVNPSNFVIKIA